MNIALCGFYGKNNFGDDLMQDCLSEILSKNKKNKVHVFSDLESENIQDGLLNKKHLHCDLIVIGGGGIINKNFWVFKDGGIDDLISSWKETIFLNVNVYPDILKNEEFILKLKSLNSQWWVRDSESHKILKSIGIDSVVMPDIAFYKTKSVIKNNKEKKLIFFPNYYAFFNAFSDSSVHDWIVAQRNFSVLANYFNHLIERGWDITISFSQHGEIDDRIIGAMILAQIKDKSKVTWDIIPTSWEEKIKLIQKHDVVLSMRYHTTLISVINRIPCIDIVHHDKNKYFWKDLQFFNKDLNMYTIDNQKLFEMTNSFDNFSGYLSKIDDYCTRSTKKWVEFEKILNEKMK